MTSADQEVQRSPIREAQPAFDSPFVDGLGIESVNCGQGACELRLPLATRHMNTWGMAHGGISMTLADLTLALAARSIVEDDTGVVTIEMKLSFMQPGRGVLISRGRVLHRSTRIAYCEGEIVDNEGLLVAKSLGTFRFVKKWQS